MTGLYRVEQFRGVWMGTTFQNTVKGKVIEESCACLLGCHQIFFIWHNWRDIEKNSKWMIFFNLEKLSFLQIYQSIILNHHKYLHEHKTLAHKHNTRYHLNEAIVPKINRTIGEQRYIFLRSQCSENLPANIKKNPFTNTIQEKLRHFIHSIPRYCIHIVYLYCWKSLGLKLCFSIVLLRHKRIDEWGVF